MRALNPMNGVRVIFVVVCFFWGYGLDVVSLGIDGITIVVLEEKVFENGELCQRI